MEEDERQYIGSLIRAIALGDNDALTKLYDTIGGRMLSVAFGVLHDRGLAEDALQESFLKIVEKAAQFRYWENAYGWACAIVRNTSLNMLKVKKKKSEVPLENFYNLTSGDETDKSDMAIMVERAMATLDEESRRYIYFKYFLDMTVRQIAARVKKPKSTVARQISCAEELLKKYFGV